MRNRRSFAIAIAVVLAASLRMPARAEVAVETDAYGRYVRTVVVSQASVRQQRIWKVVRRSLWGLQALNPDGDRIGDQYPAIAENRVDRRHPWVVWSRFNGADFDLVYSHWHPGGGWSRIEPITVEPMVGDDLAPSVAFNPAGRPFLAWWSDEGGIGRVYVSFYLLTRWSDPLLLSDPGTDSRTPHVVISPTGQVEVEFATAAGHERRGVAILGTSTITDDLQPVGQVRVTRISADL